MWDWLSKRFSELTFSDFANITSILSFIVTLYVFYAVRKIKSFYVYQASGVKDFIDDLLKEDDLLPP
jgi:hypothetical protein